MGVFKWLGSLDIRILEPLILGRLRDDGNAEVSERLAQDLLFFCAQSAIPQQGPAAPRVAAVREALERRWTLSPSGHRTGGPARYVHVAETGGTLGFITPMSHNFCESCNRVRLTCTGTLYMCLGQEDAADLRADLRGHLRRHAAAHELAVPVERCHDLLGMLATERHDIGIGDLEIIGHAHFGHGDHRAAQGVVVDVPPGKNGSQRVAHQFADAQHALVGAGWSLVFAHWPELSPPGPSVNRRRAAVGHACPRARPGGAAGGHP